MLRRRFAFFVISGCLGATLSCAAILGFEPLSEEGGPDAQSETSVSDQDAADGARPSGPCGELGVPDPTDGGSSNSVPPLIAALRLLDFGMEVDGGPPPIAPGLNLDRVCSTDLATSSCKLDLLASAFDTHAKDKTSTGLDNAGFGLIQFIGRFSEVFNADGFNRGVLEGKYGMVLRISRWNGEPNDSDVTVELFPTIGFQKFDDDGGTTPRFTADDVWKLDNRFQLAPEIEGSRIVSNRGWVTNGRLVARFTTVTVPIAIEGDPKSFDVVIRDAIVSGAIDTEVPLSDGIITGRWKTTDFLDQLKKIYILDSLGFEDTFMCAPEAAGLYSSIKEQVCLGRDLRSDSKDNEGLPCDAVSAAARVETYRLNTLGNFVDSFDAGPRCEISAVPANDDCN